MAPVGDVLVGAGHPNGAPVFGDHRPGALMDPNRAVARTDDAVLELERTEVVESGRHDPRHHLAIVRMDELHVGLERGFEDPRRHTEVPIELIGPYDHVVLEVPVPAADASHLLRGKETLLAGARALVGSSKLLLRVLAVGDVVDERAELRLAFSFDHPDREL